MSTEVQVETTIRRPRDEVARYAMDPANDRSWIGALTDVEVLTDGPFGAGTQVRRVAQFLGKRIEYVNEVVEHAPPERLASGFYRLAGLLLERSVRKNVAADLGRLKAALESAPDGGQAAA